jgi:hypothetical protein
MCQIHASSSESPQSQQHRDCAKWAYLWHTSKILASGWTERNQIQ